MVDKLTYGLLTILILSACKTTKVFENNKQVCFFGVQDNFSGDYELYLRPDSTYHLFRKRPTMTEIYCNQFDSGKVQIIKNKIFFKSNFHKATFDISNNITIRPYFCCYSTYKTTPESIELTIKNKTIYNLNNINVYQNHKLLTHLDSLSPDKSIIILTINKSKTHRDTITFDFNSNKFDYLADKEINLKVWVNTETSIATPMIQYVQLKNKNLVSKQKDGSKINFRPTYCHDQHLQ